MSVLGFQLRPRYAKAPAATQYPAMADAEARAARDSGELEQTEMYSTLAAKYATSDLIYMCVTRLAEMTAMQAHKLRLFNSASPRDPVTDVPEEEVSEHPFLELWRRPNPWQSSFDFLEAHSIMLNLGGNVYWHVDDGQRASAESASGEIKAIIDLTGQPAALWQLRPDRVTIKTDAVEYIKGYVQEINGEKTLFLSRAVRHFKRFHPLQDFTGLSPVVPAQYAALSDVAAQVTNYALFKNSMRLSGIVQSDRDTVDPAQVKLMEDMLLKKYTGDPSKAHQLAFLWSNFKYIELGMNMRDAEFTEGAKLNRMRIFGVFGVHPAVVLSEDINRANAQVGEYMTLKFTVEPMLARLAAGLSPLLNAYADGFGDADAVTGKKAGALGDPRLEAHFVGVVPQDDTTDAAVSASRASATKALVEALGPEEGVAEAIRQGLISEDVLAENVPMPSAQPSPFGGGGNVDPRLAAVARGLTTEQYP